MTCLLPVRRTDAGCSRRSSHTNGFASSARLACVAYGSTTSATLTRPTCLPREYIRRSQVSDLATQRSALTMDLYSHVMPGMQEDAAARVDASVRTALEKRHPKGIG